MKHVSEWSLALIIATMIFSVVWWLCIFGRTEYEVKPPEERNKIEFLWSD